MRRQFQLRPSNYLAAILAAAHGSAIAALFPLTFPWWGKAALMLAMIFSLGYQLRRLAWLSAPCSVLALTLDGDLVMLDTCNGEQFCATIQRDSLVTPYLTVLNILPQGARFSRSIVILPDSMEAEPFRQLRVCLKWGI